MARRRARPPAGAVLAGGLGRRIGGDKATVELAGRPLIDYSIDVLHEVCDEVAVVAKRDTILPPLRGRADLWIEPDEPRHPLAGVAHALERAGGRDIVTLPVDLPLVPPDVLRALAAAGGCAMVRGHPLLAHFEAGTAIEPRGRAMDAVLALAPRIVEGGELLNVNTPEDLAAAEALVRRSGRTGAGCRSRSR
jgi:molybdenum cofactor guanylyltransferase